MQRTRYCYVCGYGWPWKAGDRTCPACGEVWLPNQEWTPLPVYIREETARIRRGWTAKQRRQRYRGAERWTVPQVPVPHELRDVV